MAIKGKSEHFTKASEVLKELRGNVTSQDRKEAVKEFHITDVTISNYLNGHVRDLGTAEKLVVFFRSKIRNREQIFSAPIS